MTNALEKMFSEHGMYVKLLKYSLSNHNK